MTVADEKTGDFKIAQIIREGDPVRLYANDIQIQTSSWDLRLIFGAMKGLDENGVLHIHNIAEVALSPEMAKRLSKILIAQLTAYESRNGPIPEPKTE